MGLLKPSSRNKEIIDIPILGAGGAGKSTFFKALQIAKLGGFNADEKDHWTKIMKSAMINLVTSAASDIQSKLTDPEKEALKSLPKKIEVKNTKKSTILSSFTAACTLYKNESVKNQVEAIIDQGVYAESMHGFFEKIEAMKDPEYKATEDDILRFRHKTTDFEELVYDASDEVALRFIDCGGQRDLRERWTQFATSDKGNVQMVIFVMALDGYTKTLQEDKRTNCMTESVRLLKVLANKYFKFTEICVFMNKHDLFQEVIKTKDPSTVFPEYTGG